MRKYEARIRKLESHKKYVRIMVAPRQYIQGTPEIREFYEATQRLVPGTIILSYEDLKY